MATTVNNVDIIQYNTSFVYCRRHGPSHLLNERYREPTHDSKQNSLFICKIVNKQRIVCDNTWVKVYNSSPRVDKTYQNHF